MSEVRARQLINFEETRAALEDMHCDVVVRTKASRKRKIYAHNRKTKFQQVNFVEGDIVLVRRRQNNGHKVQFKWVCRRRACRVRSEFVYKVEDLVRKNREVFHARSLVLYISDIGGEEVDPALLRYAEHAEAAYQSAL